MFVYKFPTDTERALTAEREIDGGHEDGITPFWLRRYPFSRLPVSPNGSPIGGKRWQGREIYHDAA